jgi:hypothetical protein
MPQRRLLHRNLGLFTATRPYFAAMSPCSPQPGLIHRNLDPICRNVGLFTATWIQSAATWTYSPQPQSNLPQRRLVHRNLDPICRNLGLSTATWIQFAATSTYPPQPKVVCRNVSPICRNVSLSAATSPCLPQPPGRLQQISGMRRARTSFRPAVLPLPQPAGICRNLRRRKPSSTRATCRPVWRGGGAEAALQQAVVSNAFRPCSEPGRGAAPLQIAGISEPHQQRVWYLLSRSAAPILPEGAGHQNVLWL